MKLTVAQKNIMAINSDAGFRKCLGGCNKDFFSLGASQRQCSYCVRKNEETKLGTRVVRSSIKGES
jgi:hypothetical protein